MDYNIKERKMSPARYNFLTGDKRKYAKTAKAKNIKKQKKQHQQQR